MVWKAPFVSPLQSTTSKTFLTPESFLCPTQQDDGEIHTSAHLKVGELGHTEEAEPRTSSGSAGILAPGHSGWVCSPSEPGSSNRGGTWHLGLPATMAPIATGSQTAAVAGPMTLVPPAKAAPATPASPHSHQWQQHPPTQQPWRQQRCPWPWFPLPHCGSSACDPGVPRHGRGACHPSVPGGNASDSSNTGSSKAQAVAMRTPGTPLAEVLEGGKCWFSNIAGGHSRETKTWAIAPPTEKQKERPLIKNSNC